MDTEAKVFRVSKGYRTLIYALGPLFAAGGLALAAYQVLYGGPFFTAKVLVLMVIGLGFAALGVCGVVEAVKSRLQLLPDRLREVGVFRTKEYVLANLKGFRVVNAQGISYLKLFYADDKVAGLIGLNYEGLSEIGPWIEARLENLDAKELNSEVTELLDDAALGNTQEERKEALGRAWRWYGYLHKAAVACFLWSVFPKPYKVFFFTTLLLPLFGLYIAKRSHDLFMLDGSGKGARPLIIPILVVPAIVLALRAMLDWKILDWLPFWGPFGVCAACFLLASYVAIPDVRKKFANICIALVFALIYSYGAVLGLNGLLDNAAPARHTTRIIRKYTKKDRHIEYYFAVARTKDLDLQDDIQVGRRMYNAKREGEPIDVLIHPGRLAIPWLDAE